MRLVTSVGVMLLLFTGCVTQPRNKKPSCPCCDRKPACAMPVPPCPNPVRPEDVTPANARQAVQALDRELDWYRQPAGR
jgi:hypothetical protein